MKTYLHTGHINHIGLEALQGKRSCHFMCRYIIKSGFHWGLEQALLARQHNTTPISIFTAS